MFFQNIILATLPTCKRSYLIQQLLSYVLLATGFSGNQIDSDKKNIVLNVFSKYDTGNRTYEQEKQPYPINTIYYCMGHWLLVTETNFLRKNSGSRVFSKIKY